MRCLFSMRGWPTVIVPMQVSTLWHHQAPAFHCGCLPTGAFLLEDCAASGSVTPGAAQLLARMIEAKLAFLISGGTGSGKLAIALTQPEQGGRTPWTAAHNTYRRAGPGVETPALQSILAEVKTAW
jgi:hypothetical protein